LNGDAVAFWRLNRGEANSENQHTVYARHWYKGTWKSKEWKKITRKHAHEEYKKIAVKDRVEGVPEGAMQRELINIVSS